MKSTLLFIFTSCAKESNPLQPNSSNDSTLYVGKWNLIRDELINLPPYYRNSIGLVPNSGVYTGKAGDYYDFKSDKVLVIYGNNQTGSTTYLYQENKLVINGDLFKNLKILTLTSSSFSFECRDTSSNGGTYYHKVDLSK